MLKKSILKLNPVKYALSKQLVTVFSLSVEEVYSSLSSPPKKELGDYAMPCFLLAKALKKAPAQIAVELAKKIEVKGLIQKVEAFGPYINFTLDTRYLANELLPMIINGDFFSVKKVAENNLNVMIEYSQPNTHKEIHVGHMRNLALGHSLSKILSYLGFTVKTATYPGDVGTHVAKCLWYLTHQNPQVKPEDLPEEERGASLGKIYSLAHILLEDQRGTEHESVNRQALTKILKEIHDQKGEYFEMWRRTRLWSIDLMRRVYDWCGVRFDHWFFESEMDAPSIARIKHAFQEGKLVESEGAIGMDLSADNLGFCLLLKSDGNGLYSTKDVELAVKKFEQFKIQKSIYVVDVRQSLHFKQVFKVLEKLGYPLAKDCFHLSYDFVELPDGPMSSRKGNIVPITDLMQNMQKLITEQYLSRYVGDWEEVKIAETAHRVAQAAIFYGMLKIDPQKKIIFDMREWLKLDGESGPYLLYVYARIQSILQRVEFDDKEVKGFSDYCFEKPTERELMNCLSEFGDVVVEASEYRPSHLCNYLFDLCKVFNHFYLECPILKAESESMKKSRIVLAYSTSLVLKKGIELLGFQVVDQM